MSDSITFKIELPPEGSLLLNLEDKYFDHMVLEWENESDKDSVFTTVIPRYHKTQKIDYGYGIWDSINKKPTFISQDFVIDSLTESIHMKVIDRKVELVKAKSTVEISNMENAYEDLRIKIFKEKENDTRFISELDSLNQYYDNLYVDEKSSLNNKLNRFEYYDKLYGVDPGLVPLDSLMRNTDLLIARSAGPSLVYKYLDENINSIGFELMNPSIENESSSSVNSKIFEKPTTDISQRNFPHMVPAVEYKFV